MGTLTSKILVQTHALEHLKNWIELVDLLAALLYMLYKIIIYDIFLLKEQSMFS